MLNCTRFKTSYLQQDRGVKDPQYKREVEKLLSLHKETTFDSLRTKAKYLVDLILHEKDKEVLIENNLMSGILERILLSKGFTPVYELYTEEQIEMKSSSSGYTSYDLGTVKKFVGFIKVRE